ncbi:putative sterigmatocystin biosynthesis monooxygenase stcW [Aspergillus lentulus]|uniref:Sterigmatocystin biosynthesis monooxygenase stcW n=1 Tax=Aspergillus lentulus TaxID=293939 RepID=A0AAN4TEZ8_ASPLE|nr:putative sterigmatocystin biosynthesis monooxygenase stcW [Aspergillus lentulus]
MPSSTPASNPVFEALGLSGVTKLGGNTEGPHPSSRERPVHRPEWDIPSSRGYVPADTMINEPLPDKPFKIIFLGAGAAGIDFLHWAPRELKDLNVEIVCYEKNGDVGGTWLENRYPGCACDVPSISYSFPWKSNPQWSHFYSSSQEIHRYMRNIVDEEGMMSYIHLRHQVIGAKWIEETSKWTVTIRKLDETDSEGQAIEVVDECDVLLNGGGFLNAWKWPDIPGLHSFKGDLFHSATYKDDYDLSGKRLAVIGNGSSGIQVVAEAYKHVSKLYTWIRSPTWILAAIGQRKGSKEGQNFEYTEAQKAEFARDPEKYHRYHKTVENSLNGRFRTLLRDTAESDEVNALALLEMQGKLKDRPDILEMLQPKNFSVNCRRPTPGSGYLEALVGEKTTVLPGSISAITERGVVDINGKEHEVDVIICATGFDTSFRPRFPITGLDPNLTLANKWATFPSSYLGVSVDGFPNYFTYGGPFTPVAQGTVLPILTLLTKHFLEIIKTMRTQHIRRLSPRASAVEDFAEHAEAYLPRTTWADPCNSWYKMGTGDAKKLVMWPGSRLSYFEVLRHPMLQDYEIEYWSKNRWGYMGNGFVDWEFKGTKDLTWYLDEFSDHPEFTKGVPLKDPLEFVGLADGRVP